MKTPFVSFRRTRRPASCRGLRSVLGLSCLLTLAALGPARAQYSANPADGSVSMSDPSEVFLKAFTSVQQGEKLEEDGKLRPALAPLDVRG